MDHRTTYGRNKQGEQEEITDSIKQTYHTSATIECHDCGTSLQYEELQCTYISIPQVSETYEVLLSQPWWMWAQKWG